LSDESHPSPASTGPPSESGEESISGSSPLDLENSAGTRQPEDPVSVAFPASPEIAADSRIETAEGTGPLPDGFYPHDPRQIGLDRFGNLIFSLVLLAGLTVAVLVLWLVRGTDWIMWLVLGGGGLLVGLSFWSGIAWPPVEHRHKFWRLDETGLEIRRGVFWKSQISIPLARLQHADLVQGPLQRRYGLARLTIHTAGTENASVELSGLAMETATWLRDQLIRQRGVGDVV
jgi:uncharacterized protein